MARCFGRASGARRVLAAAGAVAALVGSAASAQETTPALEIVQRFPGTNSTQTAFDPADTMGAVGPAHVVEILNGRFAVYRKADGTRVRGMGLDAFLDESGVSPEGFAFDPRVVYDAEADRWVGVAADDLGMANGVIVVVSDSGDPEGEWTAFRVPADDTGTLTADFPTIGFNEESFIVASNLFDVQTARLRGGSVLVLPKPALYATPPSIDTASYLLELDPNRFVVFSTPVMDFDMADGPVALVADNAPHGQVTRSLLAEVGGEPLWLPPSALSVTAFDPPPDVEQPGGTAGIDPGKVSRFGGGAVMRNGSLWVVSSVDVDGRSALRWFELDGWAFTVRRTGVLSHPERGYFYGSIAVNEFEELVIGCNGASGEEFIGSYAFAGRREGDEVVWSEPVRLRAGTASYFKQTDDGRNRWGDYSATVVDPVEPHVFWTFQQVPISIRDWEVEITKLRVPEPGGALGPAAALGVLAGRKRARAR